MAELGTAQQPAWLAQPAAAADLKWELDRLGGQPPPPAAAGKDPAAPSWGHAPGAEGKPAAFAAELDDLAKELEDPGREAERPSSPRTPCAGEGWGPCR